MILDNKDRNFYGSSYGSHAFWKYPKGSKYCTYISKNDNTCELNYPYELNTYRNIDEWHEITKQEFMIHLKAFKAKLKTI